jgi:hypothetical protein
MNTGLSRAGLPSSRQGIFPPFRLQPPTALAGHAGLGFLTSTYRAAGKLPVVPEASRRRDHSVIWATPVTRRLAKAAGRIEFAYATDWEFTWGCSPPPFGGRSYLWLPDSRRARTGTSTLPVPCARRRTSAAVLCSAALVFPARACPAKPNEKPKRRSKAPPPWPGVKLALTGLCLHPKSVTPARR